MGLVGKKQRMVESGTLLAVLRSEREDTNGACVKFGFNYGTYVHLLHIYVYLSLFIICYLGY